MRFSPDDTSTSFKSNLTKIETYQTELGNVETSLSSYLTNAKTYVDSINLGDWSDKVEQKFSSYIDNSLKPGVTAMNDDLSGGSFNTLKENVDSLHTAVNTCYTKKDQLEKKILQLDRTPEYNTVTIPNPTPSYMTDLSSTADDYITAKEKNPAYTKLKEEIETLKGEVETAVGEANGYLNVISTITFDPTDTSGGAGNGGKAGDGKGDSKGDSKGGEKDAGGKKDDEKTAGKARGNGDETPSGKQEDGSTVVRYGDTVTIGNKSVVYLGTSKEGTNLYKDPVTGAIYYTKEGSNELKQSNGNANLISYGVNAGGEILYPGDWDYERTYKTDESTPFKFVADGNTGVRKGSARGDDTTPTVATREGVSDGTPEVNVVFGDNVTVQGKSAVYVGTTDKGINIYKDPTNDSIYYQMGDGELRQSNADYTSYINYGANINGEVVYPGDVTDSAHYSDGSQAPFTYQSSGGYEAYNTYEFGEDPSTTDDDGFGGSEGGTF